MKSIKFNYKQFRCKILSQTIRSAIMNLIFINGLNNSDQYNLIDITVDIYSQ